MYTTSFEKIGGVLLHQLHLIKKSQSELKSPRVKKEKKKYENKTTNEWTWNILTTIHDFKFYSLSLQLENIK